LQNDSLLAERLKFMGIDSGVCQDLQSVWKDISPELPKILERFYTHMHRQPQLSKLIGTQQSRLVSAQMLH
jgi:hypothetical protein